MTSGLSLRQFRRDPGACFLTIETNRPHLASYGLEALLHPLMGRFASRGPMPALQNCSSRLMKANDSAGPRPSPPHVDPGEGMHNSKNIQEPQNHQDDHDSI